MSLAVLKLTQYDLLDMDFGDINEYFKRFKDDDCTALPDIELIIKEAYKIKITDEKIEQIIQTMP